MAHKLTPGQIEELRQAFSLFDKNGDNTINVGELRQVIKALGRNISETEVQEMICEVDNSGNGQMEFGEFVRMMVKCGAAGGAGSKEKQMLQAFEAFDKDGSGAITASEMREALASLGQTYSEDEIRTMMHSTDRNSDGTVDYREFISMMNK